MQLDLGLNLGIYNEFRKALDFLSVQSSAAYSLRKLRNAYTGSAIRVRRSLDNAEADIGFSGTDLDTTALTNFVGGNGFVTTWYDQSGNARNATQATAANQPRIVTNGVVNTVSGKPVLRFDGSNDIMEIGGAAFATGARSAIAVAQFVGGVGGLAQLKTSASTFFELIVNIGSGYQAVSFIGDLTSSNSVGFGGIGATLTTNPIILHYQYNGGNNTLPQNYAATLNGTPQTIVSSGTFIGAGTNLSGLGGRLQAGGIAQFPISGFITEYVVFDGALSTANRQTLERNQGQFYSITVA